MEQRSQFIRERYVENQYAEIWFENGLVYAICKPDCVLSIDATRLIVQDRKRVSNGKKSPIFLDLRNMVSADNATRTYLASAESQEYITAGAILINNYIQRMLMNLWLKIDKPVIPTKGFTDKEKALQWLEQYKFLN